MTSSEEFLAHYGVKGMKWGQTRAVKKEFHKQAKTEFQAKYAKQHLQDASGNKRSAGKRAAFIALDVATAGGVSATRLMRTAGYSKGKTAAVVLTTGVHGANLVASSAVKKTAKERYKAR